MIMLMLMGRQALQDSCKNAFVRIELPGPLSRFRIPISLYPKVYAMLKVLCAGEPNPEISNKILQWAHGIGVTDEEIDLFSEGDFWAAARSFDQIAAIGSELAKVRSMSIRRATEYVGRFLV